MLNKPLIAITGAQIVYGEDEKSPLLVVRKKYFELVEKYLGIGSLISNNTSNDFIEDYAKIYDGLLLTGGGDIAPEFYGQKSNNKTGSSGMTIDKKRDQFELALTEEFVKQNKPVLGVCRGCQLINVSLGGTLNQHLDPSKEKHLIADEDGGWYTPAHDVVLDTKSELVSTSGLTNLTVNSVHHQAVDILGDNLSVFAKSKGGITEGIINTKKNIFGVQWHIEQMPGDKFTATIMEKFIDACKKH